MTRPLSQAATLLSLGARDDIRNESAVTAPTALKHAAEVRVKVLDCRPPGVQTDHKQQSRRQRPRSAGGGEDRFRRGQWLPNSGDGAVGSSPVSAALYARCL